MQTRINKTDFTAGEKTNMIQDVFQQYAQYGINDLLAQLANALGKKSFLVFKHNKYFTVPVDSIAFFYVKYETSILVCTDRNEYVINHSLDHIQSLLTGKQFFRVNRQYLVNFAAVKEVEHYFARKLLVNLCVATADKLLVPKEKVRLFLNWMEDR